MFYATAKRSNPTGLVSRRTTTVYGMFVSTAFWLGLTVSMSTLAAVIGHAQLSLDDVLRPFPTNDLVVGISARYTNCRDVRDFRVVPVARGSGGDGRHTAWRSNTHALQTCIDSVDCCKLTGGDIYTADVFLRSHSVLVVAPDARLVSVLNGVRTALLQAQNVTNVTITGGGVLYGNAEHYISYYDPRYNRFEPIDPDPRRPRLLLINESSYINVHFLSLQNSSDWTLHIRNSEHVTVHKLRIYGDRRFPNNDGIDPDSSSHVHISHCVIDVADDGVCPKARDSTRVLHNLTVTNVLIRSRSHAIKFGSHTDANMTDILFENITILDSNSGLAIQQRGPGNIDNITFRNIYTETRYDNPRWWGNGEWLTMTSEPRNEGDIVGRVTNLRLENVRAVSENGGLLSGRGSGMENVSMTNIQVTIRPWSNYSNGSGPPCSYLVGMDAIVPCTCMGTRDYRPSWLQGDDPLCVTRGACRTRSKAHGLFAENIENVTLANWTVTFGDGTSRLPWYGHCSAFSGYISGNLSNWTCINGEAFHTAHGLDISRDQQSVANIKPE